MITPRSKIEYNLDVDRGFVIEPKTIVISVTSAQSPQLIVKSVISIFVLINSIIRCTTPMANPSGDSSNAHNPDSNADPTNIHIIQ